MNKQECDVLNALFQQPYINQRILSECCGHSLGIVNRSIKNLINEGYIDKQIRPTPKAVAELKEKTPKNAIILAAGFGMRMVPINMEIPKALLEVHGEPLIERIIKQLHEVNIYEIYVVVGFMKEKFEYLIDNFGVELIINREYATKNNIHSLKLVLDRLSNSYIIPCDLWCAENPFCHNEMYSWYMVSNKKNVESKIRVNRKGELVTTSQAGNTMIGISYLAEEEAGIVRKRIRELCCNVRYDGGFWEEALYERNEILLQARVVDEKEVVEINTYEQLRELDSHSSQLKSDAIDVITETLHVKTNEIVDITVLKKGMTNRSFLFTCRNKKYIMRIPGEGTDQLINRTEEARVYEAIDGFDISDNVVYINSVNGYKLTEFLQGARNCDPESLNDLQACMKRLREFHGLGLQVEHTFDIFEQIEFYEKLWEGTSSVYRDYEKTKENVFSLKSYIEEHVQCRVLTHIDAVPDNFLFVINKQGQEEIRLIDWEYAGMQDPHVDIAMFCIYSLYDKSQVDKLIDLYFVEGCSRAIRIKIYCYIASCGLLWSNWCEYKRNLGVEFGEYSIRQYRYAKDYYRIVREELKNA